MAEVPTIYALATAPGRAAISVIRVSGPRAGEVLDRIGAPRPAPGRAVLRAFRHPATGEPIDSGLAIWRPAPNSFTGEDTAELQGHGGRAVTAALLAAISAIPNCRLAEPGEFARRAFENGRLDLAQAEGLSDLIDAETEAQRRQALSVAGGSLSRLYEGWRATLIEAIALMEAAIDFSDEADVAADAVSQAEAVARRLVGELRRHLDDGRRGEIIRSGFRIVIAGPPNAGKSSLLNVLAKRDAAIVSAEAGTTRDVIEVHMDLGGYPVILADTAGVRSAESVAEREGVRRALARAEGADLILWLTDVSLLDVPMPDEIAMARSDVVRVGNKIDLAPAPEIAIIPADIAISVHTGQGLNVLLDAIEARVRDRLDVNRDAVITQQRHRDLVKTTVAHVDTFVDRTGEHIEIRVEELRGAANALGRITGRVDAEDVLGQVFARFCIGK